MEQPSTDLPAVVEAEVVGIEPSAPMAPVQIAVNAAQDRPRSIEVARKELFTLATLDEGSAQQMFYTLKRSGKNIEGPSIRFAESVMSAFGNLQVFGRVVDVGASTLVAEGGAWDMQKNTLLTRRVTRKITDKNGNRYSQDMIAVTENAAISIAIRNAILEIIPKPYWAASYEATLKIAAGDEKTIKSRRTEWLEWWKKQGGTEDQLWQWLEIKGPDDIGGMELRTLTGLRNAINEGQTTFQREMDVMGGEVSGDDEADALDAKLRGDDGKR